MKLPLISIIIPVFNAEKTIEKTLESVFNQLYSNFQVIVVDGKSTDNSVEIIKRFEKVYYFVSENDLGIYDAMNKGVNQATGDYLFFLGADDCLSNVNILSHVFSDLANLESNNCPDVVYGNVQNVGSKSSKTPKFHKSEFSSKLIWKNTLHHQSVFYSKSIFNDFRYDATLQVLADYELNLILLNKNPVTKYFNETISICVADGVSKDYSKKLYKEELLIKKRNLNFFVYLVQIPWVWMKYLYKNF